MDEMQMSVWMVVGCWDYEPDYEESRRLFRSREAAEAYAVELRSEEPSFDQVVVSEMQVG